MIIINIVLIKTNHTVNRDKLSIYFLVVVTVNTLLSRLSHFHTEDMIDHQNIYYSQVLSVLNELFGGYLKYIEA